MGGFSRAPGRCLGRRQGPSIRERQASVRCRKGGPIRRLYEAQVKAEFLDVDFERDGGAIRFEVGGLSEVSLKVLRRKLDRLARDFEPLADLELALPVDAKQSIGHLAACRPWVFSILTGGAPERPT